MVRGHKRRCGLLLRQFMRMVAVNYVLGKVINSSVLKTAPIPVLLRARCRNPGCHRENDGILVLLKLFSFPLVPTLLIHLISVLQVFNVFIGASGSMVFLALLNLFVFVVVANAQV